MHLWPKCRFICIVCPFHVGFRYFSFSLHATYLHVLLIISIGQGGSFSSHFDSFPSRNCIRILMSGVKALQFEGFSFFTHIWRDSRLLHHHSLDDSVGNRLVDFFAQHFRFFPQQVHSHRLKSASGRRRSSGNLRDERNWILRKGFWDIRWRFLRCNCRQCCKVVYPYLEVLQLYYCRVELLCLLRPS